MHAPLYITPNNLSSGIILEIRCRDLGLRIVVLTMSKSKKVYKSVFEKIASEISRCQNKPKTKQFLLNFFYRSDLKLLNWSEIKIHSINCFFLTWPSKNQSMLSETLEFQIHLHILRPIIRLMRLKLFAL